MTELDIAYRKSEAPENWEQKQAEYYRKVFQTYLENGVKNLGLWGVRDSESWINHFQDYNEKYKEKPLLFDKDGNKKDSYREVKDLIHTI